MSSQTYIEEHMKKRREYWDREAEWKRWYGGIREIELAENILREVPKNFGLCVEIGAGDGYLTYNSSLKGLEALGLDISVVRCRNGKKNVPKCDFIVADAMNLPFRDDAFDVALSSETLEHVPDMRKFMNEIYRILDKNGLCIITIPFRENLTPNV